MPVRKSHIFTTTRDDQRAVKIRVLQGESQRADENHLLGEFVLERHRPRAPGPAGDRRLVRHRRERHRERLGARSRDGPRAVDHVQTTGTLSEDEIQEIIAQNANVELPGDE